MHTKMPRYKKMERIKCPMTSKQYKQFGYNTKQLSKILHRIAKKLRKMHRIANWSSSGKR
jgi:hypothetical protein